MHLRWKILPLLFALLGMAGASQAQTTAKRAFDFRNFLGTNSHIAFQGDPNYDHPDWLLQEMAYLGLNQVRDGAPEFDLPNMDMIAANGIKVDMVGAPGGQDVVNTLPLNLSGAAAEQQLHPGSVISYEAPNELNGQIVYYNGVPSNNSSAAFAIQQAVWNGVRGNSTLSTIPVVALSVYTGDGPWQQFVTDLGNFNLAPYDTYGNFHTYASGNQPWPFIAQAVGFAKQISPGRPYWITESGICSSPAAGQTDENTQAKNMLNLISDNYKQGVVKFFIYELMETQNPATNDCEARYGLFRYGNGTTPKPVATAIHNMFVLLTDTSASASTFTPGTLNYSVTNLPNPGTTGFSQLFQTSNGTFWIEVWNEAQDWNSGTGTPITVNPVNVTVNLGSTIGTVNVYDPYLGTTATQSLSNVSSVVVPLTDHPVFIAVGGSVGPPPVESPNFTVITTVGPSITDSVGTVWTLTAGGQVAINGVPDATTGSVIELAYVNHLLWQENANNLWWFNSAGTWLPTGGTSASPLTTVWNSSDTSPTITLSSSNTVATSTSAVAGGSRSTTLQNTGLVCFEVTANTVTQNLAIGISNTSFALTGATVLGFDANGVGFYPAQTSLSQAIYYNGAQALYPGVGADVSGDPITTCVDFPNQLIWVSTPVMRAAGQPWNNWSGATPGPVESGGAFFTGLVCPCYITVYTKDAGTTATINAAGPFATALPPGYSAWQPSTAVVHHPLINNFGQLLSLPYPANDNPVDELYIPARYEGRR